MVREGLWDVPLVVESAQVFDTHHVALLVAAGASAVVPHLMEQFAEAEEPGGMCKVRTAVYAGLRKVLARMGVSTLASYRNSCLFEIVGLSKRFARNILKTLPILPGKNRSMICSATISACTPKLSAKAEKRWRTPDFSASAKAPNFTPTLPK